VIADATASDQLILISYLGIAPLVASFVATWRQTAIVGAVAVAAALLAKTGDTLDDGDWAVRVGVVITLSAIATLSAFLREARDRRLQRMTVIAEAAQRAVLRAMPTAVGQVGLAARYLSATDEALVGGDLYEVAATPTWCPGGRR